MRVAIVQDKPITPPVIEIVLRLTPWEAQLLERLLWGTAPLSYEYLNNHIYYPLRAKMAAAGLRTSQSGDVPFAGSEGSPLGETY